MTHAEQLAAIEKDMLGKIERRDWHGVADCAMDLRELEAEARIRAQLPLGMEHCKILFRECDVGHGWLTAANWIDHGCPHCKVAK